MFIAAFMVAGGCGSSKQAANDAGFSSDADAAPDTLLGRVTAIVVASCAVAGCHDAVSKTHSMDLSTSDKIVSAWVNQLGFDHCTGLDTPRVIPGDAAGSLVVLKIEGVGVCAQSQRMPLPPRDALTAEQIAVIREWIAAGAPSDRAPNDAGGGEADAGGDADGEDGGGPAGCTATNPCPSDLTCAGATCGSAWECVSHFNDTLEHPCAPERILFCGCDGVTFEASFTCPDRPWLHAGACDDGASCTEGYVECTDPKPNCPQGQAPSVVGGCWGACVPESSCRCLYHWMCPNLEVNTCLPDYHCGPRPPPDAGTDGTPTADEISRRGRSRR